MNSSEILTESCRWVHGSAEEKSSKHIQVKQLPGDASTRKYFRITTKNPPEEKYILMSTEPFVASQYNFLLVQKLFRDRGILVPEVFAVDESQGCLLLSDLGDSTMLHCLEASMQETVEISMFRQAIDLMLAIHQVRAKDEIENAMPAFKKAFDEEILLWEIDFTLEHFMKNYLRRNLPASDSQKIREAFVDICQRLAKEPRVFTHRDFHTRNIMVTADGRYHSIDFQDARQGLRQYDLASLLRDSYYQMKEEKVYGLLNYYFVEAQKSGANLGAESDFIRAFDLMSIQRNFKAIGSFASFYSRRGDARYLRFIGNTFENVRRNLVKFPEYQELHQLLFNWYYF